MATARSRWVLLLCLALIAPVSGCGGGGSGGVDGGKGGGGGGGDAATGGPGGVAEDAFTDDAAFEGMSALRIAIPAEYTGKARKLVAVVSAMNPPMMTTEIVSVDAPVVRPAAAYLAPFDASKLMGDLYVLVFLYMEGGGDGSLKQGVDYAGNLQMPVTFDGTQREVGPVYIRLLQ